MDVDHDLLAAGHPRLNFEFSAFHAAMPHHWPDAKDRDPSQDPRGRRDFEALAWLIGHLVTTQAGLELLATRAADERKPWPEFAEHLCAACHQSLSATPSQKPRGRRLEMPWADYAALAPFAVRAIQPQEERRLANLLANIHENLSSFPAPDRRKIALDAKSAATQVQGIIASFDQSAGSEIAWDGLLRTMIAYQSAGRHQGTRLNLGLAAIQQGHPAVPIELSNELKRSAREMVRPTDDEPTAIKMRLLQWQKFAMQKGL